ncbi:MAG: hypothetical protein H6Q48_4071 [Deltaproteobacteria bacterium]|nr:hypothetical protein [Deltaproteobacteria bacterium]
MPIHPRRMTDATKAVLFIRFSIPEGYSLMISSERFPLPSVLMDFPPFCSDSI